MKYLVLQFVLTVIVSIIGSLIGIAIMHRRSSQSYLEKFRFVTGNQYEHNALICKHCSRIITFDSAEEFEQNEIIRCTCGRKMKSGWLMKVERSSK